MAEAITEVMPTVMRPHLGDSCGHRRDRWTRRVGQLPVDWLVLLIRDPCDQWEKALDSKLEV